MPSYLSNRVLRLERLASTAADPQPANRDPVVIYDPALGEPQRPADLPSGAVCIMIPDNHRGRYAEAEAMRETEPLQPQPTTAEDRPIWRTEIF